MEWLPFAMVYLWIGCLVAYGAGVYMRENSVKMSRLMRAALVVMILIFGPLSMIEHKSARKMVFEGWGYDG